jgi:Concanavalin A-like lectin/glucanases superfamily
MNLRPQVSLVRPSRLFSRLLIPMQLLAGGMMAQAGNVLYPGPMGLNGNWGVRTYMNHGIVNAEDLAAALVFLNDPATKLRTPETAPATTIDSQLPFLNCVDPQTNSGGGVVGNSTPFPGNTPENDDHVLTVAHALINVTDAGDYTFNCHSDDGFLLRVLSVNGPDPTFASVSGNGSIAAPNEIQFTMGTGDADTRGVINLQAGIYKLEYVTWEGGGDFFYQLTAAKGAFAHNAETNTWRPVGYVSPQVGISYTQPYTDRWTVYTTAPGGVPVSSIVDTEAAVTAAVLADPVAAISSWNLINFTDPETNPGSPGRIPGDAPWPRNTAADDNNYGLRATTTLFIADDGDYLLGYAGDDGSRLTVGNPLAWRAFNDSAYKPGQLNSLNATTWGIGRNFVGAGTSGLLKNIHTGALTAITATWTEFLTVGSVNSAGDTASFTAASEAGTLFGDILDPSGTISYGDAPGWYVDLTLTGLDPAKSYTFAGTANRNGGAAYAPRVTNWSLLGADSSSPASSTGVVTVSPTSVEFSTGDNGAGLLARWRNIRSGSDGTVVIRTTHGTGAIAGSDPYRGYGGGLFMVAEQSVFSTIAERSTEAGASAAATIGRKDTIAANQGSLGAAVNFGYSTNAVFERPGALAGSTTTGIEVAAATTPKMQTPFSAALTPSSFTVEAWVKPAVANATGTLTCVMANGQFASPRSGWLVYQSDSGWILRTYNQNGAATSANITGGPAPVVGQWHHLAVTWDGTTGTAKIYVNGTATSTAAGIPFVPSSNGVFTLGARSDSTFGWSGMIDEVAIYPSVLSGATIAAHIANANNAGRSTPYQTLVMADSPLGYWSLNEATQPIGELNTIFTDVGTGNSTTVGRIHLAAGDYPLSTAYFEGDGGSWFEVFGRREVGALALPFVPLSAGGAVDFVDLNGLQLVNFSTPRIVSFSLIGTTLNVTFGLTPGLNYIVESSTDLVTWAPQSTFLSGPGATTPWTTSVPSMQQHIYWRARLE